MPNFQVSPHLVLFFACEDAVVDSPKDTLDLKFGWWDIHKPLYHAYMPPGIRKGFGTPELCLYYQLSGGTGDYNCMVEMHQLDLAVPKKNKLWYWTKPFAVHCPDQLAVVEDVVVLEQVIFPTPGLYQFRMKEGGRVLSGGECYLRVFAGESQ